MAAIYVSNSSMHRWRMAKNWCTHWNEHGTCMRPEKPHSEFANLASLDSAHPKKPEMNFNPFAITFRLTSSVLEIEQRKFAFFTFYITQIENHIIIFSAAKTVSCVYNCWRATCLPLNMGWHSHVTNGFAQRTPNISRTQTGAQVYGAW